MPNHLHNVKVQVRDQADDPKFERASVLMLGASPNLTAKLMIVGPDGMEEYDVLEGSKIESRGQLTTIIGTSRLLRDTMRVPLDECQITWEIREAKCKNC